MAAFVLPLAEQIAQQHSYVRFLARLRTDGDRDLSLTTGPKGRRRTTDRATPPPRPVVLPATCSGTDGRLTIDPGISAVADYQAGASPLPGGRTVPLDVFTSELVDTPDRHAEDHLAHGLCHTATHRWTAW